MLQIIGSKVELKIPSHRCLLSLGTASIWDVSITILHTTENGAAYPSSQHHHDSISPSL